MRAAVPTIHEDDTQKSPVDTVSRGVVPDLPADAGEQSLGRKFGMGTETNVLVGSDPTCTVESLGTISKYPEPNRNKVMPKIGVMNANYSFGGTAQEGYSPFEPRRSGEIHDSSVTTPVNGGTDSNSEGRNDEDHDVENRNDRHTTTGAKPSRPLTPSAEGTNQDVEGWNDEDQDNENGDDRQTTAGVKPMPTPRVALRSRMLFLSIMRATWWSDARLE